jgi:hypothetical protein
MERLIMLVIVGVLVASKVELEVELVFIAFAN